MTRTQAEDTALVIANAAFFTVVAFRGCGRYDRLESPTLEAARRYAQKLYTDRPVAVYAVAHGLDGASERVVHVENRSPSTRGT